MNKLTDKQKAAVKKAYLSWTGGFGPLESRGPKEPDYVDCGACDQNLDPDAVNEFLDEWQAEEEAAMVAENDVQKRALDLLKSPELEAAHKRVRAAVEEMTKASDLAVQAIHLHAAKTGDKAVADLTSKNVHKFARKLAEHNLGL